MITKMSIFILSATIGSTTFGLYLLIHLIRSPQEKSPSSEVTSLLYEGLLTLNKRVLSTIIQVSVYTIIALGLFSYVFNRYLDWTQMGAFLIGSSIIGMSVLLNMLFTPHMVPKIISSSKGYLEPGLHKLFKASNALSMTTFGLSMTGFLFCKTFLGAFTIIGYALGITFASFFVRISSGLFKSGADIGADSITQLNKKIPHNHPSNPANLLDIIGTFIGSLVGFTSDILGSFIFTLTACLLSVYSLETHGIISEELAKNLYNLPLHNCNKHVRFCCDLFHWAFTYQN